MLKNRIFGEISAESDIHVDKSFPLAQEVIIGLDTRKKVRELGQFVMQGPT